jgi:hypothetical protein
MLLLQNYCLVTAEKYNEDSIKSLDWREYIAQTWYVYIGKLRTGLPRMTESTS